MPVFPRDTRPTQPNRNVRALRGHPPYRGRGSVPSEFPTIGVKWLANNRRNLEKIATSDRARHIWLHQRAYLAERLVVTTTDPLLTQTRIVLNWARDSQADFRIEVKCVPDRHRNPADGAEGRFGGLLPIPLEP
jgi:hypothetical protein